MKAMKRSFPCILFLVLWALFAGIPRMSLAQESSTIKISPVRLEAIVSPGETLTQSIKVTNDTEIARKMHIYVRDFKAEGEEGTAKLLEPGTEEGNFLSSWIVADQGDLEFGPFEERVVSFQVVVPPETGPGGYYGAVAIGNRPTDAQIESQDKGAAISVAQQTNCLLLFTVRGDIEEEALIKDFVTDKTHYSTPVKVKFITRIENLGNVHVQPIGFINIFNMFGEKKGEISFNDNARSALPKTVRKFEDSWENEMGFGRYKAEVVLSYGMPPDAGGEGRKSLTSVAYFWVIPWRIIAPIAGVFLFLLIALVLGIRFYKNRAIKLAMEAYNMRDGAPAQVSGEGQPQYQAVIQPEPAAGGGINTALIVLAFILIFATLAMAGFFIFFA
jgi:hypothetical protein